MSRQDSPKGRRCRSRRVGAVRSDRLPGGPPRGLQARCWRERAAPDLTKVRLDQEGRDGPRRVGNCVSVMRSRLPLPRVSVADRVAQCCESVDYLNQPTNDVLEAVVEIRAFVVDAKALRDRLVLARKVPLVVFAARRQRLLQRAENFLQERARRGDCTVVVTNLKPGCELGFELAHIADAYFIRRKRGQGRDRTVPLKPPNECAVFGELLEVIVPGALASLFEETLEDPADERRVLDAEKFAKAFGLELAILRVVDVHAKVRHEVGQRSIAEPQHVTAAHPQDNVNGRLLNS